MKRNYVAEVKEHEAGEPCFLMLIMADDIGLGSKSIVFHLPDGTGIAEAQTLRDVLHQTVANVRLL